MLSASECLLGLLLVLLLAVRVLSVCPSVCTCSPSHREVDCSWKGLRWLPDGLQHNLHSLNLSHNRLHSLDGRVTAYAHLRILDLSHNRLGKLPSGLPRSLWQLHASANRIRLLEKNDTAYQWNLHLLDLSDNKLERAVFINNTLINLRVLNLSRNHFWTVPTNMPAHLETVDLSHNFLVQVLPGSLDRLPRLAHFYLHANRFSVLPLRAFAKLTGLRVITLGDNPWSCHLHANITYLLSWLQHTTARVLGCPCHTQPICGERRPARTGGWHFASYTMPPLAASDQDLSSMAPQQSSTGWWHRSVSALVSTQYTSRESSHMQHHPFTSTPLSISTLLPRTTDAYLVTDHPSTITRPSTVDHMFLPDPQSITDTALITEKPLTTDSLYATDTASITHTTVSTDTAITTDMNIAADRFFTTESTSVNRKKTTNIRTRSVRRPHHSLTSGVRDTSSGLTRCSSLLFIQKLWLLTLTLPKVL